MTAKEPTETTADVQPDDDELDFLQRGLQWGEGFEFYAVQAESIDTREALIERLLHTDGVVPTVIRGLSDSDLVGTINQAFDQTRGQSGRPVAIITDIEESAEGSAQAVRRLNEQRNQLIASAPGAILLLGGKHLIEALRHRAPDTWSARAADIYLDETVTAPVRMTPEILYFNPILTAQHGEFEEIHKEWCKLERGDRRGRMAMRLAELLQFSRARPEESLRYYQQAHGEITEPSLAALAGINASLILLDMERMQEAEELLTSILLGEELPDSVRAFGARSMAYAKRERGDLDASLAYAQQALDDQSDLDLSFDSYMELCRTWIQRGEMTNAIDAAQQALDLATQLDNRHYVQVAHSWLLVAGARGGRHALVRSIIEQVPYGATIGAIDVFDHHGYSQAAELVWSALRNAAGDVQTLDALHESWTTRVLPIHDLAPRNINIDSWKPRLSTFDDAVGLRRLFATIRFVEGLIAWDTGAHDAAYDIIAPLFTGEGAVSFDELGLWLIWIGILTVRHYDAEATQALRAIMEHEPRRFRLLAQFAELTHGLSRADGLHELEGAAMLTFIRALDKSENALHYAVAVVDEPVEVAVVDEPVER